MICAEIIAVIQNLSFGGIIQSAQQIEQRGFSTAGCPHDRLNIAVAVAPLRQIQKANIVDGIRTDDF